MNAWILAVVWVFGWAILGGLMVAAAGMLAARNKRRRLIAAGLYPGPGTETEEDAQRLLQEGHEDLAVRCYQAVHRVSYREARDRLLGPKPAGLGFLPIGLVLGLSMGLLLRNTALGAALGLLLGVVVAWQMRKAPPRDQRPE